MEWMEKKMTVCRQFRLNKKVEIKKKHLNSLFVLQPHGKQLLTTSFTCWPHSRIRLVSAIQCPYYNMFLKSPESLCGRSVQRTAVRWTSSEMTGGWDFGTDPCGCCSLSKSNISFSDCFGSGLKVLLSDCGNPKSFAVGQFLHRGGSCEDISQMRRSN